MNNVVSSINNNDLNAMKTFIALLRNSAIEATELADLKVKAKYGDSASANPLDPTFMSKLINRNADLRAMWKALTPAQRDYAFNRYIRNTASRMEWRRDGYYDAFESPLEHDYQRTHNYDKYKSSRSLVAGSSAIFANISDMPNAPFLYNITDSDIFGALSGGIHAKIPFTDVTLFKVPAVPGLQRWARDIRKAVTYGGMSQYRAGDPRELAAQPLTKDMRVDQRIMEHTMPVVTDLATLYAGKMATTAIKSAALAGRVSRGAASAEAVARLMKLKNAPKYKRFAWGALRGADFTLDTLLALRNPVDFTYSLLRHPVKAWQSGKTALSTLKTAWTSGDKAAKVAATTATAAKTAMGALNATAEATGIVSAPASFIEANRERDSIQPTMEVDSHADFKAKHPKKYQELTDPPKQETRGRLSTVLNNLKNSWDTDDTIATTGAALGGGALGALVGGKRWLLGGLAGAGLAGLGAAIYRYNKKN